MGRPLDRHLPLLHGLEQRRLRAGRGPVDLVDEEDVREDGAWREPQGRAFEEARPGHVYGQEIRRPLDARRFERQRPGDRPSERRLARSRDILDEDVAVGEEGEGDEPERRVGADDRPPDLRGELLPEAAGSVRSVGGRTGLSGGGAPRIRRCGRVRGSLLVWVVASVRVRAAGAGCSAEPSMYHRPLPRKGPPGD